MSISYRVNTKADEPALVELWNFHAGWGLLTVEQWQQRFVHTPAGPAAIILAVEDQTQEIMAQLACIPQLVLVQGREVSAYRPFAVIVNARFRSKTGFLRMQQTIVKLYLTAADILAQQGAGLLYMLPDPRWARVVALLPFCQSTTFPLWSRSLALGRPAPLPTPYSAGPLAPTDARIDELCGQAAALYACLVARDTRTLPWKLGQDPYQLIGVFHEDRLIGLFAAIKKREDNQWLLADVLAADAQQSLKVTLQAACLVINDWGAHLPDEERTAYCKIAVLCTPTMEPALRELGFQRDNYDFLLVVQVLSKELAKEQASPARWYVSAND